MKTIAMIPMRLGSVRIPKKNIRYLLDKPLLQYPIELALKCERFDGVWVNTECENLKPIIEKMGAEFHRRPDELASGSATNREFTYEFLQKHQCDYLVMINTTSPLLKYETLVSFVNMVESGQWDTIVSVISEKAETFFREQPINFSLSEKVNSQLLEPTEKVIWAMTAWNREVFMSHQERGVNPIFGGRLGRFSLPKDEACDLDTQEDWNVAEGILISRQNIHGERYLQL